MTDLETYLLLGAMVGLVVAMPALLRGISRAWDALARASEETRDAVATRGVAPVGEGCCVACGSDDVERLAPGVYACRACGYEGGAHRAAWEHSRRQAAWGARPWTERLAAARTGVEDARRRLLALEADARRWPAREVVAAYVSTYNGNPDLDLVSQYTEVRQREQARQALVNAIREALAPLYAAADAVPGLAIAPPEDPAWDGEPDAVFARAQAATGGALARIAEVEAQVQGGAGGAGLAGPTRPV